MNERIKELAVEAMSTAMFDIEDHFGMEIIK